MPLRVSRCRRAAIAAGLLCAAVAWTGCYTKYQNVAGGSFPRVETFEGLAGSAGIAQSPASSAPSSASVSPSQIVERFARRAQEEHIFEAVIYPYTELAQAHPAILLDALVRIEEKLYWTENIVSSVLQGASFGLLAPAFPNRFGFVVDLSVTATEPEAESPIGVYARESEYELSYTSLVPDESTFQAWLDRTVDHAIEDVLNQIKRDLASFPAASTAVVSD